MKCYNIMNVFIFSFYINEAIIQVRDCMNYNCNVVFCAGWSVFDAFPLSRHLFTI